MDLNAMVTVNFLTVTVTKFCIILFLFFFSFKYHVTLRSYLYSIQNFSQIYLAILERDLNAWVDVIFLGST